MADNMDKSVRDSLEALLSETQSMNANLNSFLKKQTVTTSKDKSISAKLFKSTDSSNKEIKRIKKEFTSTFKLVNKNLKLGNKDLGSIIDEMIKTNKTFNPTVLKMLSTKPLDKNGKSKLSTDVSSKAAVNIRELNNYSSRLLNETITMAKNMDDGNKELNKIYKKAPKKLSSILGKYSKELGNSIQDINDVFKFQELAPEISDMLGIIRGAKDDLKTYGDATAKAAEIENKFGVNLKKLGIDVKALILSKEYEADAIKNNIEITKDMQKDFKKTNIILNNFDKTVVSASKSLSEIQASGGSMLPPMFEAVKRIGSAIIGLAEPIYEATKQAGKFGVSLDPYTAALTGLTLHELPELQGKFKQTSLSIGGTAEMNKVLLNSIEAADGKFVLLAGGLGNLSKSIFAMTDNVRSFGDTSVKTESAVLDELKMFDKFQNQMGMTTDQFNEMTSELIQDSDIREQLMKMDKSQRKSYIDNARLRMLEANAMGLTRDQALSAAKALATIQGQDPMDRIKEASKVLALGGALGMNKEARQIFKTMIDGPRASSKALSESMENMAKITEKQHQLRGKDLGHEIAIGRMSKDINFLQKGSPFGDFILGIQKRVSEVGLDQAAKEKGISSGTGLGKILNDFGITMENQGKVLTGIDRIVTAKGQGGVMGAYSAARLAAEVGAELLSPTDIGNKYLGNINDNTTGIFNFLTGNKEKDIGQRIAESQQAEADRAEKAQEEKKKSDEFQIKTLTDLFRMWGGNMENWTDGMKANYNAMLESTAKQLDVQKNVLEAAVEGNVLHNKAIKISKTLKSPNDRVTNR